MTALHAKAGARLRRGAYFLPSLFTIGNLVMGFYAVLMGVGGHFRQAALLIIGAAVLDSFDGRIARMMGTESDFGREYDSLADVVTFGMAPALVAWFWGLRELGDYAWAACAFYAVCCATRLARFNVQTKIVDSRYFVGLPAPAAAGAAVSILFFAPDKDWKTWVGSAFLIAMLILGLLMVSTFRYQSFKKLDLKRRRSYRMLLPLAGLVLLAMVLAFEARPGAFFLALATLYASSGPLGWLFGRLRAIVGGSGGSGTSPTPEPPITVG